MPFIARGSWRPVVVGCLLGLLLGVPLLGGVPGGRSVRAAGASVSGLHVAGNTLVNSADQPVRLYGVNRSGAEFACAQGRGIFDGPADDASVAAITTWQVNTVRVPLNEDCWLCQSAQRRWPRGHSRPALDRAGRDAGERPAADT